MNQGTTALCIAMLQGLAAQLLQARRMNEKDSAFAREHALLTEAAVLQRLAQKGTVLPTRLRKAMLLTGLESFLQLAKSEDGARADPIVLNGAEWNKAFAMVGPERISAWIAEGFLSPRNGAIAAMGRAANRAADAGILVATLAPHTRDPGALAVGYRNILAQPFAAPHVQTLLDGMAANPGGMVRLGDFGRNALRGGDFVGAALVHLAGVPLEHLVLRNDNDITRNAEWIVPLLDSAHGRLALIGRIGTAAHLARNQSAFAQWAKAVQAAHAK